LPQAAPNSFGFDCPAKPIALGPTSAGPNNNGFCWHLDLSALGSAPSKTQKIWVRLPSRTQQLWIQLQDLILLGLTWPPDPRHIKDFFMLFNFFFTFEKKIVIDQLRSTTNILIIIILYYIVFSMWSFLYCFFFRSWTFFIFVRDFLKWIKYLLGHYMLLFFHFCFYFLYHENTSLCYNAWSWPVFYIIKELTICLKSVFFCN